MDDIELETRFRYHPPNGVKNDKHQAVRNLCIEAAEMLNEILPESREKALAFTKLEEVMFWANAAIARN